MFINVIFNAVKTTNKLPFTTVVFEVGGKSQYVKTWT